MKSFVPFHADVLALDGHAQSWMRITSHVTAGVPDRFGADVDTG
ncbi:hypothetical protein ACWCW7_29760 [Nocardia tengchongensis]